MLRTSSAINSYTTRAHGIIVKYFIQFLYILSRFSLGGILRAERNFCLSCDFSGGTIIRKLKTKKNSASRKIPPNENRLKAMSHGAIFLATCNAILLLRDVKLPNTSLHYTALMFSQHIEKSSLISLINISHARVELHCKLQEKLHRVT